MPGRVRVGERAVGAALGGRHAGVGDGEVPDRQLLRSATLAGGTAAGLRSAAQPAGASAGSAQVGDLAVRGVRRQGHRVRVGDRRGDDLLRGRLPRGHPEPVVLARSSPCRRSPTTRRCRRRGASRAPPASRPGCRRAPAPRSARSAPRPRGWAGRRRTTARATTVVAAAYTSSSTPAVCTPVADSSLPAASRSVDHDLAAQRLRHPAQIAVGEPERAVLPQVRELRSRCASVRPLRPADKPDAAGTRRPARRRSR